MTDKIEIRDAVSRIRDETERLDIVVNNATVYLESGPIHEMNTADLDHTLTINLRGPALMAKHALSLLTDPEGGRIINLLSGLGQFTDGQIGVSSSF